MATQTSNSSERPAEGPTQAGTREAELPPLQSSEKPDGNQASERLHEKDSETTEPDSDEDSTYGAVDATHEDFRSLQAGSSDSPATLTSKEVIERRLQHLDELHKIYKKEYWGLLEELRSRHHHFVQRQAMEGLTDPEGQQQGAHSPEEEGRLPLREGLKRRRLAQSEDEVLMHDAGALPLQAEILAQDPEAGQSVGATEYPNPFEPYRDNSDPEAALIGGDARGSGSEDELASFSDAEAYILEQEGRGGTASKQLLQQWRSDYRRHLGRIKRLEQEMDRLAALACLCGRHNRFLIKHNAVSLGRATDASQVDIDLASEGDARKVSRHQAHLTLQQDGVFRLKNVGRRTVLVNNRQVDQGQVANLPHLSLIEVGGVRLLFMANHAAIKRATARTAQLRA